jgi:hypothetical protein
MKKNPLIAVSVIAVVLLISSSLTNVVGFQTVQSSNQKAINDAIDQKELLFQTILDIANNKEIQQIILKSQTIRGDFFNPDLKFSVFTLQVLTKSQLKQMYLVGLLLSKVISNSRIYSMVEQYQVSNQEIQKKISATIEKNATINEEITQLSNLRCDCENENISWNFPVICTILFQIIAILSVIGGIILWVFHTYPTFLHFLMVIIAIIGSTLNCFWIYR